MTTKAAAKPKAARKTARKRAIKPHGHHWQIEAPNGPVSTGRCRICGTTQEFRNSSEDSIWDAAEGRSRWNDMGISRRNKRKPGEEPIEEENVVVV